MKKQESDKIAEQLSKAMLEIFGSDLAEGTNIYSRDK